MAINTISDLLTELGNASSKNILLDPDITLDFNNEDFFYHPDDFMLLGVATSSDKKFINFNNSTLSNIYVYPSYSVMKTRFYDSNVRECEIKNGIFEVVLNNAAFFTCGSAISKGSSSNRYTFKNCIFNIKVFNTASSLPLFEYNSTLHFINCIFNIEFCASDYPLYVFSRKNVAFDITESFSSYLDIQSCEFKIRNRTTQPIYMFHLVTTKHPQSTGESAKPTAIDNNIFFFNGIPTSNSLAARIYLFNTHRLFGTTSFTNNYIASFDYSQDALNAPLNGLLQLQLNQDDNNYGASLNGYLFYDSSKFCDPMFDRQIINNTNVSTVSLSASDAKNPTRLAELGYIFAADT